VPVVIEKEEENGWDKTHHRAWVQLEIILKLKPLLVTLIRIGMM